MSREEVEKNIAELLYVCDCVIIPGFGGFVANYRSASFHPVQHIFLPPGKQISFNLRLQDNDGLLINRLVRLHSLSYEQASMAIMKMASEWKQELKKGSKVRIQGVGVLAHDLEGNITFDAGDSPNYLKKAYGFTELHAAPIIRQEVYASVRVDRQAEAPTGPSRENVVHPKRRADESGRKILQIFGSAAAILLFAAVAISLFQRFTSDEPAQFADANKEVAESSQMGLVSDSRPEHKQVELVKINKPEEFFTSEELMLFKKDYKEKKKELAAGISKEKSTDVPKVSEEKAKKIKTKKYHIIAASLASNGKATNIVNDLKSKGFKAGIVGQAPNGFFRVAYGSYETRLEALQQLANVRANYNHKAWILAK